MSTKQRPVFFGAPSFQMVKGACYVNIPVLTVMQGNDGAGQLS